MIGARRSTLVSVIVYEAVIAGVAGSVVGILLADALLAAATAALSSVGFAFSPNSGNDGLRVAALSTFLVAGAGLAVGSSIYRTDPARALAGVHRPWPEVLGAKGRATLRRLVLTAMVFIIVIIPGLTYRPGPQSRLLDRASMELFRLLSHWDGDGRFLPTSPL